MKSLKLDEKLTPIGKRASVYFKDSDKLNKFTDICKRNGYSVSEVINNFVDEFVKLNEES